MSRIIKTTLVINGNHANMGQSDNQLHQFALMMIDEN